MAKKEFADFTNQELIDEKKKVQYNKTANATLIGICVGIALFSLYKNGLVFFTYFPLILTYPFIKNDKKIKELENELKSRKL